MTRLETRTFALFAVVGMTLAVLVPATAGVAAATDHPAVQTDSPTDVTETTATFHGNLTDLGNATNASLSFEYWAQGDSTNTTTVTAGTRNSTGTFQASVSDLAANTTYVVVARANASDGSADVGEEGAFTTDDAFDVQTDDASNVTSTSATLRGTLTDLGGAGNATVWFEYWQQGDTGNSSTTTAQSQNATGAFEATVDGLAANATYAYTANARADGGDAESGEVVTFATSGNEEDDNMSFGQRVDAYLHGLLESDLEGPLGRQLSAWVVENNPGADNRPDHAGPGGDRGPPDHANGADKGDRDDERGPPDHANNKDDKKEKGDKGNRGNGKGQLKR